MADRNHILVFFHSDCIEVYGVEHPEFCKDTFPYEEANDINSICKGLLSKTEDCAPIDDTSYLVIDTTQGKGLGRTIFLGVFLSLLFSSKARVSFMRIEEALPFVVISKLLDTKPLSYSFQYRGEIYEIIFGDGKTSLRHCGNVWNNLPVKPDSNDIDDICIGYQILPLHNKDFTVLLNPANIQDRILNLNSDVNYQKIFKHRLEERIEELKEELDAVRNGKEYFNPKWKPDELPF